MRQNIRIWASLKRGNTLTSLNALRDLGVMDLPKRISELRAAGRKIKSDWLTVINRFGEKTRVRRYYL